MNILIDGRVLQEAQLSGVGVYTYQIISQLLKNTEDTNTIFYSGVNKKMPLGAKSNIVKNFMPNKIFNSLIVFKNKPTLDSFCKTKPDLIFLPHFNFTSVSKNIPVVLTIHDVTFLHHTEYYSIKQKIWHKLIGIKKQIDNATIIVCPSKQTKNDIIHFFGVEPSNICIIPHGVKISPKNDQSITTKTFTEKKYILFVGTLEPRKNIEAVVKGFLHSDLPKQGYLCILAGAKGWGGSKVNKWLNYPSIKYVGYISDQQKQQLIIDASVVVYPSFYEGFGLPLLEAMSLGTPIITSNRSAVTEVVGDTAYLIDPYNIQQTISAFNAILTNKTLFLMLAAKAKIRAKDFSWQKSAKQLHEVFETIT